MLRGSFHFGNNQFRLQLPFGKNIFQMLAYSRHPYIKQFGNTLLSEPNCLILYNSVHPHITVRRGVNYDVFIVILIHDTLFFVFCGEGRGYLTVMTAPAEWAVRAGAYWLWIVAMPPE